METGSTDVKQLETTFLVVGGGIAGVTCAETLAICCPEETIILLTESNVIKTISNLEPVARFSYKFDVLESTTDEMHCKSILAIVDQLKHITSSENCVTTLGSQSIKYRYLCICTGGTPRLIDTDNPRVIGIRDTDSVYKLQRLLKSASSIVLVGNGGIASELAYELQNVNVHWVIKDKHIASTFVDAGAAHFFQQRECKTDDKETSSSATVKRLRYDEQTISEETTAKEKGAALGPDWHRNFTLFGTNKQSNTTNFPIIYYETCIKNIVDDSGNLQVTLSTGERLSCNFLVSATGVEPRRDFTCDAILELGPDGGIAVNDMMATNLNGIYAAGDVCTSCWDTAPHWFQMRLWTQARQMGSMAGRSMAAKLRGDLIYQDFCFELFSHVTQLFGYSVVLLGRYNGQGLSTDYEILLRTTKNKEYIKFVLQNGRLRGAILIGNTDLAETCENLILNGIDLSAFGDDILNPDIDIEDFFD